MTDRAAPRMMRTGFVLVLAALMVAAMASRVDAQAAEITVVSEDVSSADPRAVIFEVQVSGAPVSEAVLMHRRYNPDGNLGGQVRAEVPSRGTGVISAELVTNGPQTFIPVGTEFTYHWVLTAEDGSTVETEPRPYVHLDGQYRWQSVEDDGITVWYYADEALAQRLLEASAQTIERLGGVLQAELDFPLAIVVWGGGQDGQLAQRSRGGVYSEQSITGGARVAPNIVHVYSDLPPVTWEDVTRHEVGHVMVGVAGESAFGRVPAWLDEGLATYVQVDKGSRLIATQMAIENDSTMRLRNMVAPTNRSELIDLFYGQSWFVVEYLVETYGEEMLAGLLASIRSGNPIDEALIEVYGVDQDGLYNEWRVSVGLPEQEFTAATETLARPDATRAPLSIPTSITSAGSGAPSGAEVATGEGASGSSQDGNIEESSGGGSSMTTAVIIGVVALVVAGALGGLGFRLLRSGR